MKEFLEWDARERARRELKKVWSNLCRNCSEYLKYSGIFKSDLWEAIGEEAEQCDPIVLDFVIYALPKWNTE
jgi:hypothetical protein